MPPNDPEDLQQSIKISRADLETFLLKEFGTSVPIVGIALEQPVWIEVNAGEAVAYLKHNFEGCEVVWVNPTILNETDKSFACPRIFVSGSKTVDELLTIARHFAGLVSFLCSEAALVEVQKTVKQSTDTRLDVAVVKMQPQMFQGNPVGLALEVACNQSLGEAEILGLAYMRQAANSSSPYWSYLSYWKVFEAKFGRAVRPARGQPSHIEAYITSATPVGVDPAWVAAHPQAFQRLNGTRRKVAHWQDDADPVAVKDPDDELLFSEVMADLPVLKAYVRTLINPKLGLNPY